MGPVVYLSQLAETEPNQAICAASMNRFAECGRCAAPFRTGAARLRAMAKAPRPRSSMSSTLLRESRLRAILIASARGRASGADAGRPEWRRGADRCGLANPALRRIRTAGANRSPDRGCARRAETRGLCLRQPAFGSPRGWIWNAAQLISEHPGLRLRPANMDALPGGHDQVSRTKQSSPEVSPFITAGPMAEGYQEGNLRRGPLLRARVRPGRRR
jgi:hypothetical protein